MAQSKDKVRFWLNTTERADVEAAAVVFGLPLTWHHMHQGAPAQIICRPSQFARWLIKRNTLGSNNRFQALAAELFLPAPTPQIYDVSSNPAR